MTQTTFHPANTLDHTAKIAELDRLAAICVGDQTQPTKEHAEQIGFDMDFDAFWLKLFGVESMEEIAAIVENCNAAWHPVTELPEIYWDEYTGWRQSLAFLGKTEKGTLYIAKLDFCNQDGCQECPNWESPGRFGKLPKHGSSRIIAWLSLADVLSLQGHSFHPINFQQDTVSIGAKNYSKHELNIFLRLHHKLVNGSAEEKQILQSLIESYKPE